MNNPYRQRRPVPPPQDPANGLQKYGIHGSRHEQQEQPLPPVTSRRILSIPIGAIKPGRYQKRETVDPEKYQQLKDQIQELGLNFVAILCVDPDDHNFYNPMMGGHLRLQAAAELGITEVSAIVREYDATALAKGTYFENNGRQQLSLIEEGLIFQQCKEDMYWTQEEIAANLLVPGGRSHVALCLLTVNAPPDIQEMLRKEPGRGQRCFYYLRQLDELGEERAIQLRLPIIQDFLSKKISTDDVGLRVKQILQQEKAGQAQQQEEALQPEPSESLKRQGRMVSAVKSFRRFAKEIGTSPPSQEERETLLDMRVKIDALLERKEQ